MVVSQATVERAPIEKVLLATRRLPPSEIASNALSFARHLRASNLSPNTQATYIEAVRQFALFLDRNGMPSSMLGARREHVESWVEDLLASKSSATAHNRYRGLRSFFKWCVDEGEIKAEQSPMARTRPPKMELKAIPVLHSDALERLLKACSGQEFDDRRDAALVHLYLSTGARKSEIGNLRWSENDPDSCDPDLDRGLCRITGKGNRQRVVDLTPATVKALDRYLRLRASQGAAYLPWLWLGKRGRLTPSGCARAIESRAQIAGLGKIHVHQLRHSYADAWLRDGGSEESLMRHLGWKSREMLSRYAASAGEERARALNRRVGLGARF